MIIYDMPPYIVHPYTGIDQSASMSWVSSSTETSLVPKMSEIRKQQTSLLRSYSSCMSSLRMPEGEVAPLCSSHPQIVFRITSVVLPSPKMNASTRWKSSRRSSPKSSYRRYRSTKRIVCSRSPTQFITFRMRPQSCRVISRWWYCSYPSPPSIKASPVRMRSICGRDFSLKQTLSLVSTASSILSLAVSSFLRMVLVKSFFSLRMRNSCQILRSIEQGQEGLGLYSLFTASFSLDFDLLLDFVSAKPSVMPCLSFSFTRDQLFLSFLQSTIIWARSTLFLRSWTVSRMSSLPVSKKLPRTTFCRKLSLSCSRN